MQQWTDCFETGYQSLRHAPGRAVLGAPVSTPGPSPVTWRPDRPWMWFEREEYPDPESEEDPPESVWTWEGIDDGETEDHDAGSFGLGQGLQEPFDDEQAREAQADSRLSRGFPRDGQIQPPNRGPAEMGEVWRRTLAARVPWPP